MYFNSIDFAIFLPVVFLLYWFVVNKKLEHQNVLILVSSYVFYGWWDWRFLSLILFSTLIDFFVGISLSKEENEFKRKRLLWLSIIVNLGFLGVFKYYNFFVDNFISAFSFFGMEFKGQLFRVILPVGISFYTFQTLSYTIDVYKKTLKPTKNFISFAAFVSFFPQLVAGPIERASDLLPQFYKKREFNYLEAVHGLRQVLWGLVKKVVIADNCAELVNEIFNNYQNCSGSTLLLGAVLFSFQIYGDFSGYSDIAIGTSRLFGFNLKQNFAHPYFSRDIAEFWRRWHISLSTWFRDYLYIPLGGSKGSMLLKIRNTFIIFLVSGFWHGANWTFVFWGAINAFLFLPILMSNKNRMNVGDIAPDRILPSIKDFFSISLTFVVTSLTWVFFRADNLGVALGYMKGIFSKSLLSIPYALEPITGNPILPKTLIILLIGFVVIEWIGRNEEFALSQFMRKSPAIVRYALYYSLIFIVFWFGGKEQVFIYFQF